MHSNGAIRARDIVRQVLPNGIILLVRENHATPSLSLRGWVQAGAVYDGNEKAGLASFTADAIERGTRDYTYRAINSKLDSLGATLGFSAGDESAGFYGRCLSEDRDALLDIMSSILLRPTFPAAEVEKVRGELLTELQESRSDTQWVADYEFYKAMYPAGHPYHLPTEGVEETVAAITRDDLKRFHTAFYRPDATVIAVVGDITPQQAADAVMASFGGWRAAGPNHPLSIPDVRGHTSAVRKNVTVPGKTQSDIVLGFPGLARSSPDFYAANVANMILGVIGLSGRLGDNVRDKQGLAYYVGSGLRAAFGPGPWYVRAGVNPANVERAITSIESELDRICAEPVSADELSEAQDNLTGSLALRCETNDGVAAMIVYMETHHLGLDYLEHYNDIIYSLKPAALQAAARAYIDRSAMTVVVAGPAAGQ